MFLNDCKGIVTRCLQCLKRKLRIPGYRYSICICNKITETLEKQADLVAIEEQTSGKDSNIY